MRKYLSNDEAREVIQSIRQSKVDCAKVISEAATLGRAIKQRREALGFSVDEVAWCTDLTTKTVEEIERGNDYCSLKFWLQVANVLGVDLISCERASECT